MIRNRNVKAPVIAADAIDISKIDLEADPNATLGVTANRYLQVPTLTTAQLVTAGASYNGALVYDTTTSSLKACIANSYVELGAAGTVTTTFRTFDCESGTDPVSDTATDTIIMTGNSGAITVTGDSAADSITFTIANLGITAGMLAATLDISGKTVTLPALSVTAGMLAATLDISGKTLTLPTSQTITTPTIASFVNANHTHADAAGGGAITYVGNVLSTGNLTVNAAAGANTITIGNLSTGGIIVSDNMTVSQPVRLSDTTDISFYDAALKIWSSADGQLDIAGDVEVQVATATLDVNASTAVEIDTAAYSIDSTASSNVSVTGAQLQLSTISSGELDLTSAGLIDINAGANIDVDITGTFDLICDGVLSIDSTGASNLTATSGNLTVSTATSGNLILSSAAIVDIDAAGTSAVTVNTANHATDTTGAITLTTGNVAGGAGDSGGISLTTGTEGGSGARGTITLSGGVLDIDIAGATDLVTGGVLSIDSTGASNVSAISGNLTLSTITSGTLVLLSAGIVDIDASGTAAVTINTADEATANATATGSISLVAGDKGAGTGDGGSINLTAGATTGGAAGVINLNSAVTIATAKALNLGTSTAIGGAVNIYRDGTGAKSVAIIPGTSITLVENVVQTGAYTFGTGTSAVSLNGDTTVTTGKNFAVVDGTVGLGSGAISTTYATMVTNLNADKVDGKHVTDITAPSYINFVTDGAFTASTSFNGPGQQAENATEEAFFIVPTAGTLTKLYTVVATAPGGADTLTYTIRKNGADQTITCVISAAEVSANDAAHTVSVAAGDKISLKLVSSATTVANSSATLEFRGACA